MINCFYTSRTCSKDLNVLKFIMQPKGSTASCMITHCLSGFVEMTLSYTGSWVRTENPGGSIG